MTSSVNFDRAVEYYDQTRGFPPGVDQHIPQLFIAAGNLTPRSRVLEIGVGTGRIAVPSAPYVGHYVGMDISTGMMGKLRAKLSTGKIDLIQGDATFLPFAAHTFDAVIAVHVFHLIPTWRAVLKEIARVLKPSAPLLHGWNGRTRANILNDVWENETQTTHEARGAVGISNQETFLLDEGWTEHGKKQTYMFTVEHTPNSFLSMIEGRKWSRCWSMPDAVIERGISAVRAYIDAHFPDPNAPFTVDSHFHVQAYLPPRTQS